ncbi:MAG: 3'-5' exonuclease [Sideroxydans sp.]
MKYWWRELFGRKPRLEETQRTRLRQWRELPAVDLRQPMAAMRCVVLDVESTGLSLSHDRLISIGAVALVNGKIALGDSFYVVLKQEAASDRHNILVHGIGVAEQREGEAPAEALLSFLDYLGKDPLVAFHVAFDRSMIRRAMSDYLGCNFRHPWLDLAYVMPGLNPPLAKKLRALDDWIGHVGIHIESRHHALADALATAQLLQVALQQARAHHLDTYAQLCDLEKAQRWASHIP